MKITDNIERMKFEQSVDRVNTPDVLPTGEQVRLSRERAGLSLPFVARHAHITREHLKNIEDGTTRLTPSTYRRLAQVFSIT